VVSQGPWNRRKLSTFLIRLTYGFELFSEPRKRGRFSPREQIRSENPTASSAISGNRVIICMLLWRSYSDIDLFLLEQFLVDLSSGRHGETALDHYPRRPELLTED
jgi:hypothetical protein